MKKIQFLFIGGGLLLSFFLVQCVKDSASYPNVLAAFGSNIDLNNLVDYAGQAKPSYIVKDNTGNNGITNAKATLGRVLFYDKQLSFNNTIS